MSYLKSLEREYVMGDAQLFNEFDNSHFISNAKSAITNKVEAVNMNMKFDYYTSMLGKAIQSFSTVKIDKETIKDFLMKYDSLSKLDNSNIMVRDINYSDIGTFKPQYLAQYVTMVQVAIDKAIRGDITQEEIVRYISGEIPEKVERQVVKTSLVYGVSPKDLIKMDSTKMVKADTAYVKGKLIPFITKYDQIKNETLAEANSVMNAINETEVTVKAMLTTIEKIKASGNIDGTKIQLLNQISYNAIRGIIEVISYVSFMLLRKINTVSSNIIACNELYNDISNMYADSTMESAFDQNIFPTDTNSLAEALLQGRDDAYATLAENIYDFHTALPDPDRVEEPFLGDAINNELDHDDYDKSIYEKIIKSYLEISVGLDVLSVEGGEYLLIYDDIIKKSGFSIILEERFQNEINEIKHVSHDAVNLKRLLAEVKNFDTNMQAVANVIMETYKKLKYLQNRYADNTNGEYTDFETINELKIFLGGLEEQYKTMTQKVAAGFFERIKELGTTISSIKSDKAEIANNTIPIETSSNLDFSEAFVDYNDFIFDAIMESYDEEAKSYFDALQKSYFAEKELALRGVDVIFEADDANANGNTQPSNNEQQPNKDQTKVSVQDNSQETSKNNNSGGSITSKVSEFIRKTVDRFLEFIGKSASKNEKWLAENKTELMNRSYNNVTVNILPYRNMPSKQITDDIVKLQNNIKTITPQSLQSITKKDDLYNKLFPFISGGIKESNGTLTEQFTKYYKVGTGELAVAPISNGELKTEITTVMIPFCESYTNTFKDTLNKSLTDLGKVLDDTIASYNTTTTTESVGIFTEAEEQNSNTQGSMKEKAGWMSEAVKFYSGSILNAVRDRNADYLKVLSSLTPKTPAKPAQANNDNNTQTNTETNADNNQNA